MPAPDSIRQLVQRFHDHAEEYHSGRYNETQLRREFLDPFFIALGWDVLNTNDYAEAYKDVVHEDSVRVDGASKAPDYGFRIGGVRKFFVEAKKPAVNLREDVHPAYQLRRYAWNAKLPLSILTDFEELAVYDCRTRPDLKDKPSTGRVMYFTYDQYIDRWDEIAAIFSREAVLKGSFDRYAQENRAKSGTADVDDAFLDEISNWRLSLARNIALRNPDLNGRELNYAVQMTIDRIIFLRICEARGIEPLGQLQALLNGAGTYARLGELFRRADERYNSGLFHFRVEKDQAEAPDLLTGSLVLDDKPLKEIIANLYYPQSPYEFSVMPADILGQVYEQFLGKVIRLTPGHRAEVEEKPEVRKAGGVYYTPTYIVEYIVRHTVGELLQGKQPGDPGVGRGEPLRVLDPACGSGSFLIGAYQFLLDWYLAGYTVEAERWAKRKNPPIFQAEHGEWRLTTIERKRILLEHTYGVDIDPQAVEVTKLSLLLKVLEGENEGTLQRQLMLFQERALPNLGQNIRCGNSLIGEDYYAGMQPGMFDQEEMHRVNPFDWHKAFSTVFKGTMRNLYLVTFVTHNSRVSERMVEYGVKTGPPVILEANERYQVAQNISECIKTHQIPVVGWNVLPDHVHMIIAAESEKELDEYVRKIKGFGSFALQRSMGIEGQHIWAQKYHHELIVDQRMLENVYAYVMENHIKHSEQWGQDLVDGWEGFPASSPNKGLSPSTATPPPPNKGLKPLVEASCVTADEACYPQPGGFDAVIGNPPYVRQESLGAQKNYFETVYGTYHGVADLYTYFIEKGIKSLRLGGMFSYIVANKWLRANYGEPLRRWLRTQHIEEIIDFGDLPVFEQATTYPCILRIRAGSQPADSFPVILPDTLEFASLDEYVAEHAFSVRLARLADGGWALVNESDAGLLEKLRKTGKPLGEYVNGNIFYGIKTGLNEAFVIDGATRQRLISEDPRSAELIKPFLLGRDVKRYTQPQSERFLILIPKGWTRQKSNHSKDAWRWLQQNYPAISAQLVPFSEAAQKRFDKGEYWWELRACDYYGEFEKPKIIVPAIVQKASYYYDESGYYSNDKTCIISTTDLYLLGILNSTVPDFVLHHIASTKQGGYFEYKPMYISQLPIRVIDFSNPADVKRHEQMVNLVERMLELHKQLSAARLAQEKELIERQISATDGQIDRLVYELYGLTEEEIRIVEGG